MTETSPDPETGSTAPVPSSPTSGTAGPPVGGAPKTLKKDSVWEVYYPKGASEEKEAVPVASFPMIIYFWPAIATFFLCGLLQASTSVDPQTLGLWATAVLGFNLLVIVTDLDQKKFLITILFLAVVGLAAYITTLNDMKLVDSVSAWVSAMDVTYSTHAYLLLGTMLSVFFFIGMLQPRFDYWRLEANEFVHYVQPWGRDQSIPRQGSTVTREVPDVIELMLTFGGGTLAIRREGQVVARIEHVPFLGRRMKAIERLLGATRVTNVSSS